VGGAVSLSYEPRFDKPAPDNLDATLAEVAAAEERDSLLDAAAAAYHGARWQWEAACEALVDSGYEWDMHDVIARVAAKDDR
jgi:hypothetical protein